MAVSIVQGGPPPNFFREWCYGYISTGEMDRDSISKEDVTDPELSQLMEEVIFFFSSDTPSYNMKFVLVWLTHTHLFVV